MKYLLNVTLYFYIINIAECTPCQRVKTSTPDSVIRTVCSAWALRAQLGKAFSGNRIEVREHIISRLGQRRPPIGKHPSTRVIPLN
jgi:hypothetical protein